MPNLYIATLCPGLPPLQVVGEGRNEMLTSIPLCLNAKGSPIQFVPINDLKMLAKSLILRNTSGLQRNKNKISPVCQ